MHGKLNSMLSDGFGEALWETLIALATAAGICVSVISLAGHLDEARAARSGEVSITPSASTAHVPRLSKIDQNKTEAALDDGVLTLPKVEEAKALGWVETTNGRARRMKGPKPLYSRDGEHADVQHL